MPYERKGNKIFKKTSVGRKLKQVAKSVVNAKKAMKLLHGLEHGTIKKAMPMKKEKMKM